MEAITIENEITVESEVEAVAGPLPQPLHASSGHASGSPARKILRLGAAIIVIAGAATFFWLSTRDRVSTDDAQVDGHIGYVSPRVSGSLQEVLVDNGAFVKVGQVLVRIDRRDYEVKVDQAKAALALAESNARAAYANVPLTRGTTQSTTAQALSRLEAAEAEYNRAQHAYAQASTSDIEVVRSNIASAEASYNRAQADLERMQPLAGKQEISRQQLDFYTAAEKVAAAQLKAAQDRLAAAQQRAQTSEQGVAAAKAQVEAQRAVVEQSRANEQQVTVSSAQATSADAAIQQARANLAAAQLQLSYTTIVAPMDGEVTRKTVEAGQFVQPGQALMTIVPLHAVWVAANFKETQLARVKPGQRAEVEVDMYGRNIEGRVESVAGATGSRVSLLPTENATGNFVKVVQRIPVRIVFDRIPDGLILRPGMNVDATIYTK
jgi:membrane fusion protein, multidrug efflux system